MIKGERVYLRLLKRLDINRLYDLCNEYDVNKYNNMLPDKRYLLSNFHIIKRIPNKILCIVNEKNVIIGFVDYRNYDSFTYIIGISIGKRFWGRGYGKESIKVLSNYLFFELGVEEVMVEVIENNERAIKCCKSCGFHIKEINKDEDDINIVKMILRKNQ